MRRLWLLYYKMLVLRVQTTKNDTNWALPRENLSSGICGELKRRSDCPSQGLHSTLTKLLDITDCMNIGQIPEWCFEHAQNYLNLSILRMFEDTFSLDAAQTFIVLCTKLSFVWISKPSCKMAPFHVYYQYQCNNSNTIIMDKHPRIRPQGYSTFHAWLSWGWNLSCL